MPNLVHIRPRRLWANGWNITNFKFIYTPFWELTYRSEVNRQRIFAYDGLNDADSSRGCDFLGFVDIDPHLGVKSLKNPNFGGVKRVFKPHSRNRKTCIAYYQNYCADSNQILYSDKDHQMSFVGGPNAHSKSKIMAGCHLGKSKNRHISATVRPISTKFDMVTHFDPLMPVDSLKFQILRIQDGGHGHLEKSENRHISATVDRFRPNLAWWHSSTLLSSPTVNDRSAAVEMGDRVHITHKTVRLAVSCFDTIHTIMCQKFQTMTAPTVPWLWEFECCLKVTAVFITFVCLADRDPDSDVSCN